MTPQEMQAWRADAERYFRAHAHAEACGLAVRLHASGSVVFWPTANIADLPEETYMLDPVEYRRAADAGAVLAVVHSHVHATETPSFDDVQALRAAGHDGHIYSLRTGRWWYQPLDYVPLLGRKWVHGVTDCYSFVRDWYARTRGLWLPDFERAPQWWESGDDLIMQHLADAGFADVTDKPPRLGDGLLMRIACGVVNHVGVLSQSEFISHHQYGRLSAREEYSDALRKRTIMRVRHHAQR